MIDRVDDFDLGKRITGRKLTSAAETFWEPGRDGDVMPPELILESLCQAGTWLIMLSTELKHRAALLQVDRVEFFAPVRPGAVIVVEGVVESMGDDVAVLSGTARVGDELAMRADRIMCALLAADDLEDPDDSARMLKALTRS